MKRTVLFSLLALGLWSAPESVSAQEYEGCFLIDPSGNLIDLGNLCPNNTNTGTGEAAPTDIPLRTSAGSANVIQVPIVRRVAGIPVVSVNFNGQRSYDMLVDTGASGTVITQAMARELNIGRTGTARVDTASQRGVPMDVGFVSSMEMSGIVLQDAPVTIGSDALDIGLLGQDFFGSYDLTIRENTIEFARR